MQQDVFNLPRAVIDAMAEAAYSAYRLGLIQQGPPYSGLVEHLKSNWRCAALAAVVAYLGQRESETETKKKTKGAAA